MEQTNNPNDQSLATEKVIDPTFASFCILVVDDSRTLRRILFRELNSLGFQNILEAADGIEAINTVKSNSIDLMLLDMEMPELDGLGVLTELKSDDIYKSLPIIVISGAEQFDKTIKCIEIGAEVQPIDPLKFKDTKRYADRIKASQSEVAAPKSCKSSTLNVPWVSVV